MQVLYCALAFASFSRSALAFLAPTQLVAPSINKQTLQHRWQRPLQMGVFDYVNPFYWKREYITAAMLSRQVPSSSQVVLELYPENGTYHTFCHCFAQLG